MGTQGIRRITGYTTAGMRMMRDIRTNDILNSYDKELAQKQKEEYRAKEREKMRAVVKFFRSTYSDTKVDDALLEKPFHHGTKSQYGMIIYIDGLGDFPGWKKSAMEHFNINIQL